MFPTQRPRRLRGQSQLRRMVRETVVTTNDLIYPLFAVPGEAIAQEVKSMPGVYQLSVDKIVEEAKEVYELGIPAIILFGIPDTKDTDATGAWHDCGIVQKATEAVKAAVPDLVVIVDTCLCEYTSHGHCGYLETGDLSGRVLNDPTLELLKKTAVSQANAGADIIAPSGMMDGFVKAIREGLDASDSKIFPSFPTRPSMPLLTTVLSEMRRIRHRSLAIAAPTKWIPPTAAKPSKKLAWISPKGRTC
jgi:porphobilinogen synthase